MTDADAVSLVPATPADATLLANLLELYVHDLSPMFPFVELGADGRFGYSALPLYWSEPERRFAFLIRCGARIAGFALVTRGSPALPDPEVLDVAEFFVLRAQRRAGVGRRAAALLWSQLSGTWTVRVSKANAPALAFWSGAVAEHTGGRFEVLEYAGRHSPMHVFVFEAAGGAGELEPAGDRTS
jgi:predicted acetyltransferase